MKPGRPKGSFIKTSVSGRARANGLAPGLVWSRVRNLGWDLERALSTPKRVKGIPQ